MSVENASLLEKQQLLSEGAETPAPTRPTTSTTTVARGKPSAQISEDFADWAVGDRYKLMRILGRGSYGVVAQALDLHAGRQDAFVAIKRIQSPFEQEVDAIRLYREIHILRHMRGHDCIINLLDIVQPPMTDIEDLNDLYLVFECKFQSCHNMSEGGLNHLCAVNNFTHALIAIIVLSSLDVDTDLYKLIMSPQYLTTEHIQTFLYQMLVGIKYIHSFSVIHRDLKPAKILLNEDCSLKVSKISLQIY